uniref:UBC core domain-containing protein n=1 Tax=Globodera rostochiensis TaxID=31243 RepID=A0A914HEA9_GLORO
MVCATRRSNSEAALLDAGMEEVVMFEHFTETRRLCALRAFVCVWLLPMSSASAVLMRQLAELQANPPDGFAVRGIVNDNIFTWRLVVFGPIDTPYEGGTFLAQLDFPRSYPQRPPKMRFLSDVLHPNIFKDGLVCISILHEQGDDPFGEEKAAERWQPTLTVESIVISVQSMLSTPNFQSPANLDAALMFRTDILGYNDTVRQCVRQSNEMFEAEEQRHTNNHYEGRGLVELRYIDHDDDDDDDLRVEEHRHNDPFGFLLEQHRQNNNAGGDVRAMEAAEHRQHIDQNYGFLPIVGQMIDAEENRHNEEEDYVMGPGVEQHRQNNNDDDEEDSF